MTEKEKFDAYIKAVMNYCNEQDDPEVALNEIMNELSNNLKMKS